MSNHEKNKIFGFGTTPKSNNRMVFCVRGDTMNVELEEGSYKELADDLRKCQEQIKKDPTGIKIPGKSYEYAEMLIQRQAETIKILEMQISEEEQELFEKDKEIARLENDLEEVCEELFLEVNLS